MDVGLPPGPILSRQVKPRKPQKEGMSQCRPAAQFSLKDTDYQAAQNYTGLKVRRPFPPAQYLSLA
jgi:hypothetical protein